MRYEKNREIYKPVTLRVKRTDTDVMNWISNHDNVNGAILGLIRDDIERIRTTPQRERIRQFELIEQYEPCSHHVVASYDTLEDAVRGLMDYVQVFTPAGRVYISERFTGILPDGKRIKASKIIKAFSDKYNEEEKTNA